MILFLASTGWRIGEATALMAHGVDDSGDRIYVTMTHVNRKGEGVVEGAKSEASEGRRIRMLEDCAAMLRRRMIGIGPRDCVFTNPHSPIGLWEPSTFRNRWWRKTVEAAGLGNSWRCGCGANGSSDTLTGARAHMKQGHAVEELAGRNPTPHWMRHTHVMLCVMAGMPLPEIQRRLGHEDIKTTINVYGRMIDEMSDEVATSSTRCSRAVFPPWSPANWSPAGKKLNPAHWRRRDAAPLAAGIWADARPGLHMSQHRRPDRSDDRTRIVSTAWTLVIRAGLDELDDAALGVTLRVDAPAHVTVVRVLAAVVGDPGQQKLAQRHSAHSCR